MKRILCTVGTSVAQNCEALKPLQSRPTNWADDALDLRAQINSRLAALDLQTDRDRAKASAEINSLNRLGIERDDKIVLLATDTSDGKACALAVQKTLQDVYQLKDTPEVIRVEGLQVHDAQRLRKEGFVNLINTLLHYLQHGKRYEVHETILNPTGGFKGVVPFVATCGMLFGVRTIYIFEFANQLISLPPLPITFDLGIFTRALPALRALQEKDLPTEQYYALIRDIRPHERDLFGSLVEAFEGMVTLSPLAQVMTEIDEAGTDRLMLSPAVAKQLEKADPTSKAKLERRLAQTMSPLWRLFHLHAFSGTNLMVLKPAACAERIAGIEKGDSFYVCEQYLDHDDYERLLNGKRTEQYDLDNFLPWKPEATLTELERAGELAIETQMRQLQAEFSEYKASEQKRFAEQAEKASKRVAGKTTSEITRLQATNSRLKHELEVAKNKLEECRKRSV